MKNLTMKEIAKLAKVSQPTVSRVINGNPNVNPELRERVEKVIKQYDFVPNKTAQSLKQNKSFLIGVNLPEINNPYYTELLDALEKKAKAVGYNLILHSSRYDGTTELKNIENFIARQIDGLIYVPAIDSDNMKISEFNIPTVALARPVEPFISVSISHEEAGRLAGQHFIDEGHQTFCYVGFQSDVKLSGYKKVIEENGFTFNRESLIEIDSLEINVDDINQKIKENLNIDNYTAIFCSNDVIAFECHKILREKNIQVPQQVALIGFDDTYLAKSSNISSIFQPIDEIASIGFDKLLKSINGENSKVHIQVQPVLKVRSSSKA